jgi:uncharacterized protein (DUF433 family)
MKMLEETLSAVSPPLVFAEGGAVLRVTGTRIPLDTVVNAYLNGASAEEIVQAYSTLRLADVYAVISYYLNYREEVDTYLAKRHYEAAALQTLCELRFQRLPARIAIDPLDGS